MALSPCKSLLLHLYYYGSRPYRALRDHRAAALRRMPVTVLFYHRVADDGDHHLTCSYHAFARQIAWMKRHCDVVSLEEAQRRIRRGDSPRPCVSITFDDGYCDNCREAIPLLVREGIPCTYFVTLDNVLSGEPFAHDLAAGRHFAPNNLEQLRAMAAAGVDIGAHTFSHPDLSQIDDDAILYHEVVEAGEELARRLHRPVRYFAFPFGQRQHLNRRAFAIARDAGYEAVCSGYGGYNFPGDDPFEIQRIASDDELIRIKNRVTVDPRKWNTPRFSCESAEALETAGSVSG